MLNGFFLLKKEILGFLKNTLYIVLWLCLVLLPFGYQQILESNVFSEHDISDLYIVFVFSFINLLFLCLYICDFCLKDLKDGGFLFLINMKIPIIKAALYRSFFSLIICILPMSLCSLFVPSFRTIFSPLLTVFLFLSCSLCSYGISIITCGTDILSFLLLMLLVSSINALIFQPFWFGVKYICLLCVIFISIEIIVVGSRRLKFRIRII